MFGCSESWIGKRFSHALTAFLSDERRLREVRANDGIAPETLEQRYESWRVDRATALKLGGAAAALAMADTLLPQTVRAAEQSTDANPWTTTTTPVPLGRVHEIPSTAETVVQGQLDPTRAPIATIDSGDVLRYTNTWTHFLNKLQPGVPAEQLATLRRGLAPNHGVHSIIGPVKVNGAKPGDLLEIRFLDLRTVGFGANFHNPGDMHTGALPDEFANGHVHYFDLHANDGYVEFNPVIRLQMRPFQGTFGVATQGAQPVTSTIPGQFAGNIDCKELTVGSSLYVPLFNDGALIFTGDSHALQGDGEVNITAIETAMEEVRCQVILHPQAGYAWPMIETPTHWLMLGLDKSLNESLRVALRNTIDFFNRKAKLSRDDAYSLASLAVDFRITQMVDVSNGVHAMIPKSIFTPDFRSTVAIV